MGAWPFAEARALAAMEKTGAKDAILFETGYGPSLPHIGTFGEVVRTTMVRHAYETLTGHATNWCVFLMIWMAFEKCRPISPIRN